MKKQKLLPKEQVDALVAELSEAHKPLILHLRNMMPRVDSLIGEQVKWNSLSFYYTGEMKDFDPRTYQRDLLVCNLHRGQLLLIFPNGAKVEDQLGGKNFADGRKIITINDLADLRAKETALMAIVKEWIRLVE